MIAESKAGRVLGPINDPYDIPYRWALTVELLFAAYKNPNIESAYGRFVDEMEGD